MLTWEQQEQNWINLDPQVKNYFNYLAETDPDRTGQAFFEDTVPENIQSMPQAVNDILNGNTEYAISDKDWSHDISDHNGGSGSADNGTFEDLSLNRSRQEMNMTTEELEVADTQLQADADFLETIYQSAEPVESTAKAAEVVTEAADVGIEAGAEVFDFFAATGEVIGQVATPVVLAMKAGRAFSNDPDEQAGAAVCVGTIASVGMFTPAAPLIGIGALGWTLWGLGEGFINWLNNDPKGTPVK
jgi:hypothetical protein